LDTIEVWHEGYLRDFFSVSKEALREIDGWYQRYRKDFMPDASGKVAVKVERVKRPETRIRDFVLAGSGEVTSEKCGRVIGLYGCLQYEKHEGKGVYVIKIVDSCDKPLCPVCSKFGWASKEANLIVDRFLAGEEKDLGQVEHIVCSAPMSAYDMTLKEFRAESRKILSSLGVLGGVTIFHGIRHKDDPENPHLHVLGWVRGGYGRCRFCSRKSNCSADCDGFDNRRWQLFLRSGWFVKVMLEERKTVGGTCWYQLNHCSIDPFRRRFRVTSWFGVAGYNNFGVKRVKSRVLCPSCNSSMGFISYVGSRGLVLNPESPEFKKKSFERYLEDGVPAYTVRESKPYAGDDFG